MLVASVHMEDKIRRMERGSKGEEGAKDGKELYGERLW